MGPGGRVTLASAPPGLASKLCGASAPCEPPDMNSSAQASIAAQTAGDSSNSYLQQVQKLYACQIGSHTHSVR